MTLETEPEAQALGLARGTKDTIADLDEFSDDRRYLAFVLIMVAALLGYVVWSAP